MTRVDDVLFTILLTAQAVRSTKCTKATLTTICVGLLIVLINASKPSSYQLELK